MTDTAMIAQGGETLVPTTGQTVSSYCCECGTYDAHTIRCTCCGFDFRADVAEDRE